MSHVVTIKTEITDLEAVKAACQELGLTFLEGQKTYEWWGSYQGDSPLPEGFTEDMLGKCEHAIAVPGTTWQIGLARNPSGAGYKLMFDYFGPDGKPIVNAIGGQDGRKLIQLYGVHKATLEARRRGYIVSRSQAQNGSIQLCVTGMR